MVLPHEVRFTFFSTGLFAGLFEVIDSSFIQPFSPLWASRFLFPYVTFLIFFSVLRRYIFCFSCRSRLTLFPLLPFFNFSEDSHCLASAFSLSFSAPKAKKILSIFFVFRPRFPGVLFYFIHSGFLSVWLGPGLLFSVMDCGAKGLCPAC